MKQILIQPGHPIQSGDIESFNGRFRDQHLNEQWFETLSEARCAAATWRQDYNKVRPRSSLGRILLAQFAEQHRQRAAARSLNIKEIE
ncbi:MAG: transposase [Desulfobulbaceae bacterium]|nr:MAG: transposase [Desulfobulbaceae bacterium]